MRIHSPRSFEAALELKAEDPASVPLTGGTDLMVDLNFGRRRPEAMLDLGDVRELAEWRREGRTVRIGAGVTYTRVQRELADLLPGLASASRTVGSPQIRNRGTIGGNLGSASPAGDAHPPLLATGSEVELASVRGTRRIGIDHFFAGPKRNRAAADELIAAVHVPIATGPQRFAKVGTRNAMVIAVCSFALAIDRGRRAVGTGIGSAGPTPLRAPAAEEFLAQLLDARGGWDGGRSVAGEEAERFGDLVAAAARPIDDVRASAAYRRHALAVLARRALGGIDGGERE